MALALVGDSVRISSTDPFAQFAAGIQALAEAQVAFTGEQFVPGAGVEICYEHYHRYAFAVSLIKSSDRVLDLGCGVGYGSLLLARFGKEVYSLDRDQRCIDALTGAAQRVGASNVYPFCADLAELASHPGIPPHSIDVVVCHEFIEHLDAEIQTRLVEMISRGEGPFKTTTTLLVSTPEKSQYETTRADENPFHLHELSREEFSSLLSSHFHQVKLFWQSHAEANCLFPIAPEPEATLPLVTYLEWLNREKLIGKLSTTPHGSGVYLYAVASQEALAMPRESLLIDLSSRAVDERLAIAAHELRQKEQELLSLRASRSAAQEASSTAALEELHQAAQQTMRLQAQKIQLLLDDAERLGAENAAECRRSEDLARQIQQLKVEISELVPWRELVTARLGPDLKAASNQADILWSYVAAMGSPGHRFVSWLGRTAGKTLFGRALRKLLNLVMVLRQA